MFLKRYFSPTETESKTSRRHAADGDETDESKPLTKEEEHLQKIEKKAAELKKQEEQDKLEQIEFYKFPTIMGWYFDGAFTNNFTLHEEYAEYFNEIEDEMDAQRDLIIEETFTEKAYRNFWPPVYIGGRYFRTRGVYLDFKEVKEDPPRTPPNINYEKQRGVIGVELPDGVAGQIEESGRGIRLFEGTYGPQGHGNKRDNWYWNERKREFKPKDLDGDYIWCDDDRIWRENDSTYRTPYDWYFDEEQGRYNIRDRSKPQDYEFDQERNIYKLKGAKGPSKNGMRHNDFYYDEKTRKWVAITASSGGDIVAHIPGNREVVKGDRGKSGLTPDDFYYDGETGKMEQKDGADYSEYYYDTKDKMFKKKGQPYGPGKANHFPLDYEFDLKQGKYLPKPQKECRHIEPYDFYFDIDEGKFHRIEGMSKDKYVFDANSCVYQLKDATGPSANGLSYDDYFWSEDDRQWKLSITVKDPEMLEYHEPGKRKVLKGDRGKSGKVSDDWYYCAFDGSFLRKDPRKLDTYWYDTIDDCWKKRGQPYGPGFYQLNPEHYYFDYNEGLWLPTNTAKTILAMRKRGEVKYISDRSPYDFWFAEGEGDFLLRDTETPRYYKYNPRTGVFYKDALKGGPISSKTPKDYFFDELTCIWLPIEHPRGVEARDYKFGQRNNRMGPRGRTGRITDDYYFNFETGKFKVKEKDDQCEYLPEYGVWRNTKDNPPPSSAGVDNARDYYFDKEEGEFRLKKDLQFGEIYLNPNTNLWMQKWRRPSDYYWDIRQNKYLRKPAKLIQEEKAKQAAKAGAAGGTGNVGFIIGPDGALVPAPPGQQGKTEEELKRELEEKKDYERPWLHHYLNLAADEIRFEQELTKQLKTKGKQLKGRMAEIRKARKESTSTAGKSAPVADESAPAEEDPQT